MHLEIKATPIEGLRLAQSVPINDSRGSFTRLFCEDELAPALAGRHIVQINHSRTAAAGAVRGLHYQLPPHAEMKLVRCLRGRVWDVAVDLRAGSATFLKSHAVELKGADGQMLMIPEGFAHGFQVLEPDSELLYLHTAAYSPAAERGIRFDCKRLAVEWPLPATEMSDRDRNHPTLAADFAGISL